MTVSPKCLSKPSKISFFSNNPSKFPFWEIHFQNSPYHCLNIPFLIIPYLVSPIPVGANFQSFFSSCLSTILLSSVSLLSTFSMQASPTFRVTIWPYHHGFYIDIGWPLMEVCGTKRMLGGEWRALGKESCGLLLMLLQEAMIKLDGKIVKQKWGSLLGILEVCLVWFGVELIVAFIGLHKGLSWSFTAADVQKMCSQQ